jgi:hypothetical protein
MEDITKNTTDTGSYGIVANDRLFAYQAFISKRQALKEFMSTFMETQIKRNKNVPRLDVSWNKKLFYLHFFQFTILYHSNVRSEHLSFTSS